MCSVEGLREFIKDRLSAAAVEILTVVQQNTIQYQEKADDQMLDNSWRGETKTHTTEPRAQHILKEKITSTLYQVEPGTPQIKEDQDQAAVELKAFRMIVIDENSEHRKNLIPLESVREFINDRLSAAAVEIFTVVQQTVVQHQEKVDAQRRLDTSCRTDDPQKHVWKEKQLSNQEINSSLDQDEPDPWIKEEPQEHSIGQKEQQLELKEEDETFLVTITDEHNEHSELESEDEQLLFHDRALEESQVQRKGQQVDSESSGNAGLKLNWKHQNNNVEKSPTSANPCESDPSKKCLICDICGKKFKFFSKIQRHYLSHTGEKPFSCETCGKSFSQSVNLLSHKRTHTTEKQYSCETCGKQFSQESYLVIHKRTHTGEKPYCCQMCGKSFNRLDNLLSHKKTHSDEKPYCCETCGKHFSQQSYLITHKRTHTGEKPFPCQICGKSFRQHSHLSSHKKSHADEKLHSCMMCGKAFNRQDSLLAHMRIHTGEKPFLCKSCGKAFINPSALKKHAIIHTSDRPHCCETCGRRFSRRDSLVVHTRIHTDEMLQIS